MAQAGSITALAIGGVALGGVILLGMLKSPSQVQATQAQKGSVFTKPAIDEKRPGDQTNFPDRKVLMDLPRSLAPRGPVSLVPPVRKRPVQPEPIVAPRKSIKALRIDSFRERKKANREKMKEEAKLLPVKAMTSQTEPVAVRPRIPGPLTGRPQTLEKF